MTPDQELFNHLRDKLPELDQLLTKVRGEWTYEDSIYRYYHHSYKVYSVQYLTKEIVESLQALAPDTELNADFLLIYAAGTGHKFEYSHNREWDRRGRPMLEAFFHAKYFLEMACQYGKSLEEAPTLLPCGWAAFLYLYDMR